MEEKYLLEYHKKKYAESIALLDCNFFKLLLQKRVDIGDILNQDVELIITKEEVYYTSEDKKVAEVLISPLRTHSNYASFTLERRWGFIEYDDRLKNKLNKTNSLKC